MKIGELRQERQEHQAHQRSQRLISDVLLEAKDYAQKLRSQSEERERVLRSQLEQEAQKQKEKLTKYAEEVERLKTMVVALLGEVEGRSKAVQEQISATIQQAPELNVTLFEKPTEE